MAFRDHFSVQAALYAQARPQYPPALFAWLAGQCPDRRQAWDAGCGNGQASVALADYFEEVFASDPSASQIANAPQTPGVRFAVEPAEACSLPDASVALVTVAQAYHWFDQHAFCAQAQRVLRPGGVVAVWTYAESRVSPAVDAVFDQLHHQLLAGDWPEGRQHVLDGYRQLPFPFVPLATPAFAMTCHWRLPDYLDYLRSWSASQRHLERTGVDAVSTIAPAMAAAWGDAGQRRQVTWPLAVLAGRRRASP